jgi:hypothetical protein
MSTSPDKDFATQIMSAAIAFDTPTIPPAPAMSSTDRVAELERQVEALEAEKKDAEKRAAERYKNMLHATRHAERTEQALTREKEDTLDSKIKAMKCFNGLKKGTADLETDLALARKWENSHAQLQELQTVNTSLQIKLAQEKETATRVQDSQSNTLKNLQSKFEADKQQIKQQLKEEYEKRFSEKEKQWKEEFARQLAVAIQNRTKEHERTRQENEHLKKQLQRSQQALDWHKKQLQQQSAQRAGVQGLQTAAGIHAGFPEFTQQSPPQVRDHARKRRRLNSTGYGDMVTNQYVQANANSDAGIPTPEQQQDYANTATTPTKRKTPARARQLLNNPTTPIQLPQGPITNTSPLPSVQRAQAQVINQAQARAQAQTFTQAQVILQQSQRNGTYQRFCEFALRANASRQKAGHSQLTIVPLWNLFNQQLTQERNRQLSIPVPGQGSPQANVQGDFAMMQNLPQGGASTALQSPFLPTITPFARQTHQPVNTQSPFSNRANGLGVVEQMQMHKQYQQLQQFSPLNSIQSPAMSGSGHSPMLTLGAEYNASPPAITSKNSSYVQAIQQSGSDEVDISAQLSAEFQDGNLHPSPEDSHEAQYINGFSNPGEIPEWASPTPNYDDSFVGGAGETFSSDGNLQNTSGDVMYRSFSAATNNSTPFPYISQDSVASSSLEFQGQGANNFSQHVSHQVGLDPTLLHSGAAQDSNDNLNLANHIQLQHNDQPESHRRQPSEAPSIISIRSSHPPPDNPLLRPTTSRKRPGVAPPSSTRSTPTPSGSGFPVCLHCHEKWWNETCDAGEPCQNCMALGTSCERPKCYLEPGKCTNARCPRVHEGDSRFRYVVTRPKTLKRDGKRPERQKSPVEVATM